MSGPLFTVRPEPVEGQIGQTVLRKAQHERYFR